ncbi:MAG TPA: class I SAM-dependent methyltransferase [Jiangellaceae bacterium]
MSAPRTFEQLVAEGDAVPVDGWDFSWFEGRATEQRPSWGYAGLIAGRMASAAAALDVQTGGGEVLAGIPQPPPTLAATESWPPNVAIARRNLRHLSAAVYEVGDDADLPFPDASFDLVTSRHPTMTRWDEVARVLRPGGTYLSQQVGAGTMHELSEAMLGPFEAGRDRDPGRTREAAEAAGLRVTRLRPERLRAEFYDIAAVVHFLRKVIWTVPGFSVDAYRDQLAEVHARIESDGAFVAHSQRFLIEAHRPR